MKYISDRKGIMKQRNIMLCVSFCFVLLSVIAAFNNVITATVLSMGVSIMAMCKMLYWDLKYAILHGPKIKL